MIMEINDTHLFYFNLITNIITKSIINSFYFNKNLFISCSLLFVLVTYTPFFRWFLVYADHKICYPVPCQSHPSLWCLINCIRILLANLITREHWRICCVLSITIRLHCPCQWVQILCQFLNLAAIGFYIVRGNLPQSSDILNI